MALAHRQEYVASIMMLTSLKTAQWSSTRSVSQSFFLSMTCTVHTRHNYTADRSSMKKVLQS